MLGLFPARNSAQSVADYAVRVSAVTRTNPAQIELSWPLDPAASGYTVYRKSRDAAVWGTGFALSADATNYVDTAVAVGNTYEYRISKAASGYSGEGYIYSGMLAPFTESRGKVLLLVDSTVSDSLAPELSRLEQDLVGDGWMVLRHDIAQTSTVPDVKALIVADYKNDPTNVRCVFLLGHIPVPYSGNFAPDGHPNHVGAWPADVYYGDMNGTWTDTSVSVSTAGYSPNWNVPGDGKFDQSSLPSALQLEVGRVDLADLPAFTQTETELLRQYLNKDHQFRCKLLNPEPKGLIDDNFGTLYGEAFAVDGWRNFAAFFGATNTFAGDWLTTFTNQAWLWGYGCGAGYFTSASGVATTSDFAQSNPRVVFTMLFGSYFGDWNTENNLLRAAIATPGYTLTSVWAGRPHWQFHHMALGETIGFSTRLNQNNSGVYPTRYSGGVHIALMGDPTLRMHPVAPPQALTVATNKEGGFLLQWMPSADSVLGYHVYRGSAAGGPYTRLTDSPITSTSFVDPQQVSPFYMIRALKLEVSGSGSYFNASQGVFAAAQNSPSREAPRLRIVSLGSGNFRISGSGAAGQTYTIEYVDTLSAANWQTLGSVVADENGALQFTNTAASAVRAYRLVCP